MGRFPGLPSSILIAVGVGFLPLVATWPPSLLPNKKSASSADLVIYLYERKSLSSYLGIFIFNVLLTSLSS
jgi:hypothetical protein